MNEIDQILSNIDKDENDSLFQGSGGDAARNDEISKLIDSVDSNDDKAPSSTDAASPEEATNTDAQQGDEVPADAPVFPAESDHPDSASHALDRKGVFTIKGTKTWNRREPYIIAINEDQYRMDVENIDKAFFFVDAASDIDSMKQKIKQEIVAFLRKPSEHITERYIDFIFKKVSIITVDLSKNFAIDPDAEKLFIYHLGPQTIYKFLKEDFFQNKYGYCYKYLPGNKAIRFFPDEFIKEIVLKWFEQNINILDIPFNSIQRYEEIKKIVTRKYYSDLRIFNSRLDQLNSKLGSDKTISRVKLYQAKGGAWFGNLNINVYRRFLGNTIFM